MPAAPLPDNERERLAALLALDILDTGKEDVFDSFVRLAAELLDVPIAAVSLLSDDRQWFKATHGLPGFSGTPRTISFCAHTILNPRDVLVVRDATRDPRFADNPLVIGEPYICFYAGAPLLDEAGYALGTLCVADRRPRELPARERAGLRDLATGVSAALRLHGAIRRLDVGARRDSLTGLLNRRAFEERTAVPVGPGGTALLLLDMDGFKAINDSFGHPGGDAALQETARRLRGAARQGDTIYRLGADEFALLLDGADGTAVLALGQRIHAALADTFTIDHQPVPLRTSIGGAVLPAGSRQPCLSLVAQADAALYAAKRAGRGVTRLHRPSAITEESPTAQPIGPVHLESRLRHALVPAGAEPFTLAFQPVVDVERAQVCSLEALVRWPVPPGPGIPPDDFVPLAERTGLVAHLDRWVLAAACAAAMRWPEPWVVSVNLSAVTFGLVDVVELVRETLRRSGLPAQRLIVELTETAVTTDLARAEREVAGLRAMQVGVALDDFGAGHASLPALRRLPFSKLKIDRALVAGLDGDPIAARTVSFIAELGRMLGMNVVAEGVERAAELRELRRCAVPRAQGYLLSRPVADAAVTRAVRVAEAAISAAFAEGEAAARPTG